MAALDQSIFRKRAIEKYIQKQERHVILRLVSPPMFICLWALLVLAVCAGGLVWSIQEPVMVQGKGIVVQQKATNGTAAQKIVVLLLLPQDQRASLKVGQRVHIVIASTNITFDSTIDQMEAGVMSPAAISAQFNLQQSLAQTLSGPSLVATAPVEPMSQAQTYLESQCQVQVQVGSESALSLLPGFNNLPTSIDSISQKLRDLLKN